jgi:flagellar FliL protein
MATAPKAAKAPAEEEAQDAPKPKKSKKKLFVFLILLILIGGIGGGAAWFLMGSDDTAAPAEGGEAGQKPKTAEKGKEMKPPVFMVIEPFTVNLQPETQGAPDQFLQIAFSLQVEDEKGVDAIKLYMPQVRSRLLLLLSGKKASQISTPEGKKKLAEEIIEQIKQPFAPGMPPQPVTNVFFTSFVIQ